MRTEEKGEYVMFYPNIHGPECGHDLARAGPTAEVEKVNRG